jgi:hypothetical protein
MAHQPENRPQDERGAENLPEAEDLPAIETPDLSRPVPEAEAEPTLRDEGTPKPERQRASTRESRVLRWLLVFLIVFLLGGLAALYLFYLPEREQLGAAQAQQSETEASLAAANTRISELEAEIARLQSLQVENDRLEAELHQKELHVALLHARVDVANAWVALLQEQPDAAKAALSNTNRTLEQAVNLVAADQRDLVRGMQQRLQLAQSGIDSDVNAALSDLSVLATNLLQLENDILTNR